MSSDTTDEVKPWQHGIPIETLKMWAAPFKERYKPYVFGAFGMPKERDVANASHAGHFLFEDGSAVISRHLKSAGSHRNFTGAAVSIPAGDYLIANAVFRDINAGRDIVTRLVDACDCDVWWELFEEDVEYRQLADELGFAWVTTKIMADSSVRGLYVCRRALPLGFFEPPTAKPMDAAEIPGICCLRENFIDESTRKQILVEVDAVRGFLAAHYSSYNKKNSWSAAALRGYDADDPTFIIKPAEMSRKWKADNAERMKAPSDWTEAASLCPITLGVAERIAGRKDRIRFMRLGPSGGELTRHADITDREAGVANGRVARLHIPLRTSERCVFTSWDARGGRRELNMAERGLYYLDQRKPHACVNDAMDERIHLVMDVFSGEGVRAMIEAGT